MFGVNQILGKCYLWYSWIDIWHNISTEVYISTEYIYYALSLSYAVDHSISTYKQNVLQYLVCTL